MARAAYSKRRQQGVAMVEFAIALPLLLLLLLAIGEFGRMLFQYNSLLQASRDAGRYAAGKAWNRTLGEIVLVDTSRNYDLRAETQNIAVYGLPVSSGTPVVPGLTTADVQVFTAAGTTDHVQVSITYTFQPVIGNTLPTFFGGDGVPLNVPLTATVVMRAL